MVKRNIVRCKRGWIRLVEVFIAVVLLTGVLLIITAQNSTYKTDVQSEISKRQISVLRDIELNKVLRTDILSVNANSLPVEWEDFESEIPSIRNRIIELTPNNMECVAKLCKINEYCSIENKDYEELSGKEIYVKSIIISAELDIYSPRELKLFCSKKD